MKGEEKDACIDTDIPFHQENKLQLLQNTYRFEVRLQDSHCLHQQYGWYGV